MDRFLQRSASWIIKSGLKMAGIHLRKRKNCPNIGVHFLNHWKAVMYTAIANDDWFCSRSY